MKLSEKAIRELQVPAGKDEAQLFGPDLPGFGIRKFAGGKTFYFVKYSIGRQQRRKRWGHACQARLLQCGRKRPSCSPRRGSAPTL